MPKATLRRAGFSRPFRSPRSRAMPPASSRTASGSPRRTDGTHKADGGRRSRTGGVNGGVVIAATERTATSPWQFWIDVGGTFTDCLARTPDGRIRTFKLLSSGRLPVTLREKEGGRFGVPIAGVAGSRRFLEGMSFTPTANTSNQDYVLEPAGADSGTDDFLVGPHGGVDNRLNRAGVYDDPDPWNGYLTTFEPAPVMGIRYLMDLPAWAEIGPVEVRLGTTRGTNALLERQGADVAFVTTAGLGDALRIANQNRPKLFDLNIRKPADLYREVVEIDERLAADGSVLTPLDDDAVRRQLAAVKGRGIDSLAVCLLHSYRNDAHERRLAAIAAEIGFGNVSVSSALAPAQRIVPRGDTTVVDAYLTPIIKDYVAEIRTCLPHADLKLMTSAGGLVDAESFVGKDSILSGPAGGVVGMARAATVAGFDKAIGFDMGGTSTDVSRYDSSYERRYVMEVEDPASGGGVRIVAPMLHIETVAAGGGSVCGYDGVKPVVGPRSAGSDPGPACYGRGGPLTVTDVNLFLGRLDSTRFPFPLDPDAVHGRLDELLERIGRTGDSGLTRERLALGFLRIANANMAAAIKKVSLARGYDLREYALVSFGGAGGQHACEIAGELGMTTVLIHPYAGILSAFGIGQADIRQFGQRHVGREYTPETLESIEGDFAALTDELAAAVRKQGVTDDSAIAATRKLDLRYRGQDATLTVERPDDGDYAAAFAAAHERLYGFTFPERPIEVHALRVEVVGVTAKTDPAAVQVSEPSTGEECRFTIAGADGQPHAVNGRQFAERSQLGMAVPLEGPALLHETLGTVVVPPGWHAQCTAAGDVLLRKTAEILLPAGEGGRRPDEGSSRSSELQQAPHPNPLPRGEGTGSENPLPEKEETAAAVDPIELELFNNQFASIAEQMGVTLQNTSLSTNVKERLDFSCAIFTSDGRLVVNAPHIPVHLGAMGAAVRHLIDTITDMRPGDVYVTNDPYAGGSHLPDVTVVTPVFDDAGSLQFFTGSRAHHAEIGGIVPGSMPPFSRSLAEEGVLIRARRLVAGGQSREGEMRRLLVDAPYPSRSVDENIADMNAQTAANRTGAALLKRLVGRYGWRTVDGYMGHIQDAAATKMRWALASLPDGRRTFEDAMDDGSVVRVSVTVAGETATVDFAGTGPVSAGNLNANPAIVRSAVLYCFRCLIPGDIPLNDGVLEPITIRIPDDCLLNPPVSDDPAKCAAVGGGNVETSQRVCDVILGALGVAAASQGTMNNFLFGKPAAAGERGFGYYETICGGSGAGLGFAGADAVHTHMTNTRITDPEVFEDRYPVRLRQFSIRRGSGGAGRFPGGAGIVREIELLESLDVSLVTNRRTTAPFGLAGGQPGASGRNTLRHPDGREEDLGPFVQRSIPADCTLRIETPGGGGYGK